MSRSLVQAFDDGGANVVLGKNPIVTGVMGEDGGGERGDSGPFKDLSSDVQESGSKMNGDFGSANLTLFVCFLCSWV